MEKNINPIKKIARVLKRILRKTYRGFRKCIRFIKRSIYTVFMIGKITKILTVGAYRISKFIRVHKKLTVLILAIIAALISSVVMYLNRFEPVKFLQDLDFDIYLILILSFLVVVLSFNTLSFIHYRWGFMKRFSSILKLEKLTIFLNVSLVLFIIAVILFGYIKKHPKISESNPSEESYIQTYSDKISVRFNVPVRIDKLKPSITPEIKGEWKWESYLGIPGLTRGGYFEMKETPYPDERFVAYFAGINKITDNTEHEYGFVFYSTKTPVLVESAPANESENVSRDPEIKLDFSESIKDSVDLEFITEPKFEFNYKYTSNKSIELELKESLAQSTKYSLKIKRYPKSIDPITGETISQKEALEVSNIVFSTVKEPGVSEFKPTGNYALADDPIIIKFDLPMNRASVEERLSLNPEVEVGLEWVSDSELHIIPRASLAKDTNYSIKLDPGMQSSLGGIVESEITHGFKTIGAVQVKEIRPGANASNIDESRWIEVEFDQEVNKESAQSHFSLSPNTAGEFGWAGNTLQFKPNAYSLGTNYQIKISSGVESVHGLQSVNEYVSNFSTRPNAVYIAIPQYYQSRSFSCNINTARMILGWKGAGVPGETSLIAEIGSNDARSGDNWSGNPYKEFVGSADGNWGYGVYSQPIQNILSARGIGSAQRSGWNVTELLKEVQQGRPVIVWRYNGVGGGQNISWTASDGTYVYAFNGMHGSVVSGFIGSPENPSSIRVNDPWLGQLWLTPANFDWYWSFSGRMALIIY